MKSNTINREESRKVIIGMAERHAEMLFAAQECSQTAHATHVANRIEKRQSGVRVRFLGTKNSGESDTLTY
jgi:hypothetical protein